MSFDKKKIGEKIAALRKEKDLTQEQLAERVGITVQYLGTIERGKANTTLNRLDKIADVLGCSSNDLIFCTASFDTDHVSDSDPEIEKLLRDTLEFQRKIIKKAQHIKKS